MELPSSAYTFVNGRSCPILSGLPGDAVAAAALALPALALGVTAGPHAAASAAADEAMRNLRRDSRWSDVVFTETSRGTLRAGSLGPSQQADKPRGGLPLAFEQRREALADPDAHRGNGVPAAPPLQ